MRRAALLVVPILLIAGCGGGDLSNADRAACDILDDLSDDALAGQPDALYALQAEFDDIDLGTLSEELEAKMVRVGGSALLEQTGSPSDLPKFVDEMRDVCESLGWSAS